MTDTLVYGGHDEIMNDYVDTYYNESELAGHSFFEPIKVPNSKMEIHVWSVRVRMIRSPNDRRMIQKKIFFFSVYENGTIINPEIDIRFKNAYQTQFKRPWVECYFTKLDAINTFLNHCNIIPE